MNTYIQKQLSALCVKNVAVHGNGETKESQEMEIEREKRDREELGIPVLTSSFMNVTTSSRKERHGFYPVEKKYTRGSHLPSKNHPPIPSSFLYF